MRNFNIFRNKKGFTIIEVLISFSIFIVIVLALLGSYYSYYNTVKDLRYRNIGQNLAQLILEDIQSLSIDVISSLVKGGQFPVLTYEEPNYPLDTNPDDTIYDSGKIDGSFRIEHILNICGIENSENLPELLLPVSIEIEPLLQIDELTGGSYYDYTIILNKEIYPRYYKKIYIEDKTPSIPDTKNKIYEINVTIFWELLNGAEKSLTIKGEKSYDKSY